MPPSMTTHLLVGLAIWLNCQSVTLGIEIFHPSLRMLPGSDVINETHVSLDVISLDACIGKCKLKTACRFINYESRPRACFLYNYNGSLTHYNVSSIPSGGFVSSIKSEWNMGSHSDCSNCSLTETCVQNQNNNTSCVISGCGNPPIVADSEMFGNIFSTGSQVIYNCTGSDITGYNDTNQITCLSNGSWSEEGFTCTAPTTTTTATLPPTTVNDGYTPVLLNDGSAFRYKIYNNILNQTKASLYCNNDGGFLYGPTTSDKMDFMRGELSARYAGSTALFWTDLRNDRDPEFDWLTSTGEGIAKGNKCWAPGRLAYVSTQRCARFNPEESFYLENTYCTHQLPFVCEKPGYK